AERTFCLCLERRARGKRRIRLTARHRGHVYPFQGRKRHAPPPRPFRLRPVEERYCLQEHERRLEEGSPEHWRCRRRQGLTRRKSPWPIPCFAGRKDMSKPYTGGCACGAIRYQISAEPIAMKDCQCRDCQSTSGTGHGSYLTFASREAVKLEGEATHWDMVGDSGNVKTRGFCPA